MSTPAREDDQVRVLCIKEGVFRDGGLLHDIDSPRCDGPANSHVRSKTDTLQDSLEKYRAKIAGSARNRAAAYELALASGRAYKPGDQVSCYIKSTPKKVPAYEAARLAGEFDPQNRDENVDYYLAKLDDLVKKFSGLTAETSAPKQESLALD